MKHRIWAIFKKELIHVVRDYRSLGIIFVLPIFMLLLFGYAISFDIKDIRIAVLDQDRSSKSRELIRRISENKYMKLVEYLSKHEQVEERMLHRQIIAAVIIPHDFACTANTQPESRIQVLIDGSNANTATIVSGYLKGVFIQISSESSNLSALFEVEPRILFNPDLKSAVFIVPGLVAILLMMVCAMLTAITIAREKETGTMEQILVSPIRIIEIIIGKVTPYILLAFIIATAVLTIAIWVFQVPFRGNAFELIGFGFIFIYACLCLGIFISTRARTQQVALMLSLLTTLLPSVLLSGFVFPIASMPKILQALTYLVPARYFLSIIRGIMLKGIGFAILWPNAIFLALFGTVLLFVSMKTFKTKLEG